MRRPLLAALIAWSTGTGALADPQAQEQAQAQPQEQAQAIVSIGGPVTETIFALGQGHRVVARDTTSLFPPQVMDLPDVGYMRQLSAEGVLSVSPDLIVLRETAGPPEALAQLHAAQVPVIEIPETFSADGVGALIRAVGQAVGQEPQAEALAAASDAAFARIATKRDAMARAPRVMFVLSNQAGRLNVAGAGTGADGLITLAGGQNVMHDAYQGYKLVSDEAILEAAPEVIVMMTPTTGEASLDTRRGDVLGLPAVALTPAGEAGRLIEVAPAALGFGPRMAGFVAELQAQLIAPDAQPAPASEGRE